MPRKRALEPSELIDALRANMQLLAELSVRYEVGTMTASQNNSKVIISSPADVHTVMRDEMADLAQEQLRVLLLDKRNHLMGRRVIYQGTVSECRVRPAEVIRPAVVDGLPNIILVHNHPSGDPTPSPDDIRTTNELNDACRLLGIDLLDHVVIGGDHFASLTDLGHISD